VRSHIAHRQPGGDRIHVSLMLAFDQRDVLPCVVSKVARDVSRAATQVSERMVLAQKAYILFYIQRQPSTAQLPAFLSSAAAAQLPASSTAWTGYSNGVAQQQQPGSPTAASRSRSRPWNAPRIHSSCFSCNS
jgi:hypothetical protein